MYGALQYRYFIANLVYFCYELVMYTLDYNLSNQAMLKIGYVFGAVHFVNACLYLWVWEGEKVPIFSCYCIPDWINILAAFLYLLSVIVFPYELDATLLNYSEWFIVARQLDLTASMLDILAIFGWTWQLYDGYVKDFARDPTTCTGRGLTLDDPDLWALFSLIIAASAYLKYNIIINSDYNLYEGYAELYQTTNFWYFFNAILYVVCALRDADVFWFMPVCGRLPDFSALADSSAAYNSLPCTLVDAHHVTSAGSSSNSSFGSTDKEYCPQRETVRSYSLSITKATVGLSFGRTTETDNYMDAKVS